MIPLAWFSLAHKHKHKDVHVVVQFYPWFKFSFRLFLGMVMYDNNMIMSLKQKKRKFEPRIKLNHNIHTRRMAYLTELSIPALLNPMINKMADTILLLICWHEVWVKVTYDWSTALCLCLCLCRPSFH